jgi:hypothetical protein
MVRWHGGSPWCLPGASLPHFWYKNLKRFFQNFSRNFIFEDFLEIDKRIKTREKQRWKDRKQIKTKYTTALRYSNHATNKGNKNGASKYE